MWCFGVVDCFKQGYGKLFLLSTFVIIINLILFYVFLLNIAKFKKKLL